MKGNERWKVGSNGCISLRELGHLFCAWRMGLEWGGNSLGRSLSLWVTLNAANTSRSDSEPLVASLRGERARGFVHSESKNLLVFLELTWFVFSLSPQFFLFLLHHQASCLPFLLSLSSSPIDPPSFLCLLLQCLLHCLAFHLLALAERLRSDLRFNLSARSLLRQRRFCCRDCRGRVCGRPDYVIHSAAIVSSTLKLLSLF